MALSRRQVLIGTGAGGALIVAYALTPRRFPLPLAPRGGEYAFGAWIKIAKDGMVSVAVPQLEMGQGISTLLPQIAAYELGADWQRVAVEPAPTSGAYANVPLAEKWAPLWMPALPSLAEGEDSLFARSFAERNRFTATADGTALAAYEMPLRLAAAAAREVLALAAADQWDIDASDCKVENGMVTSAKGKLPFAKLVTAAAGLRLPRAPTLRAHPPQERPHEFPVGKTPRYPRLDGPSKVTGGATFAGDIRLPGMVYAAIAHGPQGDARLAAYDERRIAGLSGNVRLVTNERWVAAVASNWWAANRTLEVLAPRFATQHAADITTIESALDKALKEEVTYRVATLGDPEGVIGGRPSVALRYDVSPALHASLETASCTAQLRGGRLELWLASQTPEQARRAVAKAMGMSVKDVILYPVIAGGSFDARLEHPHAVEAALIAREVGKPVQLTWSRWQEHLAGLPRMPAAAMLWAKTGEQGGQIVAMRTRIAAPCGGWEFGHRLFNHDAPRAAMLASADRADPVAVEGATPPYDLAHFA
ncbi:MAG: molybdopterin cofactor-binding domain-containing protein, partial [Novosphingobium sp.]